jgi:hypothetical protein
MKRSIFCLLLPATLFAGCATSPRYQEPANDAPSATIEGEGSSLSLCGLSSNPICKASVQFIDGVNVGGSTSIKVSAGVHALVLLCFARTGITLGDMQWFRKTVTFNAAAGGSYKIKPEWVYSRCDLKLLDVSSGEEVAEVSNPLPKLGLSHK